MTGQTSLRDGAGMACIAAVPEVLETMFFELLTEEPALDSDPGTEKLDTSRVEFEGSLRGYLVVGASSGLSASLAGAFLALEDQATAAYNIEFVLGELANMLCGSALGRLQPDGTFRLSTPVTLLGQTLVPAGRPGAHWIRFSLGNGPLFVRLCLEIAE